MLADGCIILLLRCWLILLELALLQQKTQMAWTYSNEMMKAYANLHCSQEQVEESLEESYLDGRQCAPLNGTHTHGMFWSLGKMTDACQLSRSGMTYAPLTDDLGEDVLMSFLGDFPAKIFHVQEREQESKEKEAVCGNTWRESSVKFDLDTLSWKTHQCLWDEDLAPSFLTLPKWGMMLSGVLWERTTSPLHTEETESGSLLPTPTCADATMGAILNDNTKLIMLKLGKLRKISNQGVSGSIGLARTVAMWPTPTCHMSKEQDSPSEATRNTPSLTHLARGGDKTQPRHLNPMWVEWLMGWPLGWTDLNVLETDKFHK
jgi:hypothetical protein